MIRDPADPPFDEQTLERYARAVEAAEDGIWDLDVASDRLRVSPRFKALLGAEDADLETLEDWLGHVHADDVEPLRAAFEALAAGRIARLRIEHRVERRDGFRWLLCRGGALSGDRTNRIAGTLTDITDLRLGRQPGPNDPALDRLTGLPSRSALVERLNRMVARARRQPDYSFAVVVLEVDGFKLVNDSLGHRFGDRLLAAMARRLERSLRPGDSVARLGGDEFAILLDHLRDPGEARPAAERLVQGLENPFDLEGAQVVVTLSAGIAPDAPRIEDGEHLLRDANMALYRAKSQGRGRLEVFDASIQTEALARLQLETELWWAVRRRELRVLYEPVRGLKSGRLRGFVARPFWAHPSRGLRPPEDFLDAARMAGLHREIDGLVLSTACTQARVWRDRFSERSVRVGVSIPRDQLDEPDFVGTIRHLVVTTGCAPTDLRLDLPSYDDGEAAPALSALLALDVGVCLEDVPVGGLPELAGQAAAIAIKMDRRLVGRLADSPHAAEVARARILLAHGLNLTVVAEGVDASDALERLRALGCDEAYGGAIFPPVDANAATRMLAESW